MTLDNLTVKDMATLKWAVRNLRLSVKLGNANSKVYTDEQVIAECNALNDLISSVLEQHYSEE